MRTQGFTRCFCLSVLCEGRSEANFRAIIVKRLNHFQLFNVYVLVLFLSNLYIICLFEIHIYNFIYMLIYKQYRICTNMYIKFTKFYVFINS
jgi:hypothetical protein